MARSQTKHEVARHTLRAPDVCAPERPPARPGTLTLLLGMMLNPAGTLRDRLAHTGSPTALGVSGLAFLLFFLHAGLDLARAAGHVDPEALLILAGVGLMYGTGGVAFIALVGWIGARVSGGRGGLGESIRAFGLAFSPALVYVLVGLPFNLLLGWNTTLTFGVTGFLWALGPMALALRSLVNGRTVPMTVLVTVCGALLLLGWKGLSVLLEVML